MNGKGFRLQQIEIEGFKGFTGGKTLPINGKHVFILGPNGYGKSSIVEAIRWGLFGSARRPGEVVANQSYTGDCRVELQMEQAAKEWTLKRRLVPGTSETRPEVLDRQGQSHSLTEVLPQLDSVPAGEGMHIIGKAQSAPLRRMPEDVSPFERTIYSYLGLTDVRVAISRLEGFIELQEATEKELAGEVDAKRNSIESELDELTEQRDNIIKNPPWASGNVSTQEDTTSKIEQFIKELSTIVTSESIAAAGLELGSLVHEAEVLVDRVGRAKRSEVETALSRIKEKLNKAQSLLTELNGMTTWIEEIRSVQSQIKSTKQSLARLLAGRALGDLAKAVEEVEHQVEEAASLHDIRRKARAWLERHLHDSDEQLCPVCEKDLGSQNLLADLTRRIELGSSQETEIVAKRDALKLQNQEASSLAAHLDQQKERLVHLKQERVLAKDQIERKVQDFLGSHFKKQGASAALQKRIDELNKAKVTLEKQ